MTKTKAYAELLVSMVIFGTIGIFRRYISLSSGLLAFSRGMLGAGFLLLFLALRHRKLQKISGRQFLLLVLTGALIGFNWIFLFESYRYTTVAVATMCYYMQPTIVVLLSPLVLHERLTKKKLFCAGAAVLGMVLISGVLDGGTIAAGDLRGVLMGLLAAAFYASVILLNKSVTLADAYEKTILQLLAASVTILPYLLLAGDFSFGSLDGLGLLMVLLVGILHTGIAYVLYFGSMQHLPAQSVAVISYLDPVFALFLSAAVLREPLSALGMLGAVLILGSAVFSEITFKRKDTV